jgi:DNA helicase-2/ATP-dependent DNA helicase PcrA
VQGSAGSGKTTVALHRVAFLAFEDPRRFAPKRCLVVVFSRGLARYISKVLPALGVEGVRVKTYQRWCHDQRRRHFPKLPSRYSQYTPAVVTRLKNHTGLLRVLEDFAESHPEADVIEAFDEIFTNKKLLADGFSRHAPGAFSAGEIESVHRWCTRQVFDRYDREGERGPDAPTLDDEDNTILLCLHQLLRGPLKRGKRRLSYNHLVVDEVQDLSPIELAVLLDTVKPRNPITLAGDLAQKIIEESDFRDWTETLTAIGREDATLSPLRVSYRSTAPIMQVAHQVLGPLAEGDQPAQAARPGAPVELFQFADAGEAMTFLADVLRELVDSESTASVAVLARHPEQAEATYQALQRAALPSLHRVRDQDFSFAPGIEVTEISQVKGLEFDYVVLVDCDQVTYPATSVSRHLLHVGITRAAHQCWLLSAGPPSRVLPPEIESEI